MAVSYRDYPLVTGIFLITAISVAVSNLVADMDKVPKPPPSSMTALLDAHGPLEVYSTGLKLENMLKAILLMIFPVFPL
jgi:hypothetical protein